MFKVISPRVGRESAKALESYLNIQHPIEREVKFNWGCSVMMRHEAIDVWGNSLKAVARSVDKGVFFSLCKDLGTVPVVSKVEEYTPGCHYIHYDATGHNGSGVMYSYDEHRILSSIPDMLVTRGITGQEFRVYFCYGTYKMYAKVPLTEDTPHNPIQNSFNGYGYMPATPFLRKIEGLKQVLTEQTKKVASRLELFYGAVDFIMDNDYTVYILESNTAPTLFSEELCEMFATNIVEVWNV